MKETISSKPLLLIDAEDYPYIEVYERGEVAWSVDSVRVFKEDIPSDREVGMIPKWGLFYILNLRNTVLIDNGRVVVP